MLLRRRHVVLVDGGGEVTPGGARFLGGLGVDLPKARGAKRHTAAGASTGPSGATTSRAPWARRSPRLSSSARWIARIPDSRALSVTTAGRKTLAELKIADYAIEPAPRPLSAVAGRA